MKKILALFLLLCFVVTIPACGTLSLTSHTEETPTRAPGNTHSLSASFNTRMFLGSSVFKVSAGQDGAQKLWYGDKCWYVIGYDGSNMVTAESGAITLLYKGANESTNFNFNTESETANAYSGSKLESTISSWTGNFGSSELKAIVMRSIDGGSSNYDQPGYNANNVKGSSVKAILWPLSAIEAGQLGKSIKTSGGSNWWLRSPGNEDPKVQYINGDGNVISDGNSVTESLGIRPAFYLNNSSILFTSSAESGKSTDEWIVTLKDDGTVSGLDRHRGFRVTNVATCDGKTLYIDYSGALTGGSEYLSVVIVNGSGDIKYYDRLESVSASSGTIALNIEGSLGGGDTLYMFNEQNNGNKKTSYSSALNKISVPSASGHSWKEATCTEAKTCSVCGSTEGSPLGHDWKEATCTEPKTCTRCHATDGQAKGHNWEIKSCTEPRTCSVCGAKESSPVGHDWKDATCTDPKTCARCGAKEGDPLGHDWSEATCTDPKTCSRCKATEGKALGHDWTEATCMYPKHCNRCGIADGDPLGHDWVTKSCTEPRECSRCGATDGVVPGHQWTDATCTKAKTCSVCGTTEGDPLGHNWSEATCTDPKTCSRCKATEGKALGHDWAEATCTSPKHCNRCEITEGEPLGHNWVEKSCTEPKECSRCGATDGVAPGHKWTDATCTKAKTCSVCGTTEGDPLGHDWKDATCTEPKTCTRCKATEGKALGHTPDEKVKENEKAATCEQKGSYDEVVYCKVCKAELSRNTKSTSALGHKWDDGKITKNPTCEAEGEKTYTCKNDSNHTKIEKIKAIGHSWDEGKITKNPTCEEEGEKTFTCKNDSNHKKIEKVKAIGHKWDDGKITKNPTCEEEGEKTFTCKNDSKHTKVEKVKPTGHVWDNGVITKNPTCVAEGEKTFTCKNDAKHTKKEKVNALGHDWGEWKTTTPPGVDKEGVSTRYCGRCDATETMAIPPLNSCVLKFNTNGGSAIADQVVVDGTKPVKPQDPVKEGYIFTGWYIDSACKTPFDFTKELKADTTVYAGWQEETPEVPDTEPDTPDNKGKISPWVWAIVVPVVIAGGVGAGLLINKKRLTK